MSDNKPIDPAEVMRSLLPPGSDVESTSGVSVSDFAPEFQALLQSHGENATLKKVEKYVPPSWEGGKAPPRSAPQSNFGTEAEHARDARRAGLPMAPQQLPPLNAQPAFVTTNPVPAEDVLDLGFMVNGVPPPPARVSQESAPAVDMFAGDISEARGHTQAHIPEPMVFPLPDNLAEQLAMQPPANMQAGTRINMLPSGSQQTAVEAPQSSQVQADPQATINPAQAAHNEAMQVAATPDIFPEPPPIPAAVMQQPVAGGEAMAHGLGPAIIGMNGSRVQYFPYQHMPSQFVPYPFKKLWVRAFAGKHMRNLSVAANTSSLRAVAEVVGSAILTELPEGQVPWVMYLTLPDYFTLLYQLYSISFPRTPYRHEFFCTNPEHMKAIKDGTLEKDSLFNVATVHIASQEFTYTQWPDVSKPEWLLSTPNVYLSPARVADMIYCMENKLHDKDGNLTYEANIACSIYAMDNEGKPLTFAKKLELVDELPAEDLHIIGKYGNIVGDSGVVSHVKCPCKGCGAEVVSQLALSAHSFFPD